MPVAWATNRGGWTFPKASSGGAVADRESADPPNFFMLDGAVFDLEAPWHLSTHKLKRGKAPMLTAWWKLSWETACNEVERRYSYDMPGLPPRGHVELPKTGKRTVPEPFRRIFARPSDVADAKERLEELKELYGVLDEYLGRKRLRRDCGNVMRGLRDG